jgi:hypothetical protein
MDEHGDKDPCFSDQIETHFIFIGLYINSLTLQIEEMTKNKTNL